MLLLVGIDLVFRRATGASNATEEEVQEAEYKPDIAVFRPETPLSADPGTMGAVILLMALAVQFVFEGMIQSCMLSIS